MARGVLDIAAALRDAGGRAVVASPGGRPGARLGALGGRFVAMPLEGRGPLAARRIAAQVAGLVREHRVDLIHAHDAHAARLGLTAAQEAGTGFVTTCHDGPAKAPLLGARRDAALLRGRPVIAPSAYVAERLRERGRVPDTAIAVVPPGVDTALFDPDAMTGGRIIQLAGRWGLTDESRPVFLFPAAFVPSGGQETFVDACALLRARRGPDFVGLMVGEVPEEADRADALDARATAKGCADVLKIAGPCNDMPAAYRLASCAVCTPTVPLAHGRVAVEAQAMGRPAIVADRGGGPEAVEDGVTGACVPPGDAAKIAEAMDTFLSLDEETRERIGDHARRRVAERYTVERMRAGMLDAYRRALAG